MKKAINVLLHELLDKTFRDILAVEEYEIKRGPLKNLTISEVHAIETIGKAGRSTMSQIALSLDITLGALTTAISKLVKKGYVVRERDEGDRRLVYISLTRSGKLAYRIHEKFHLEMVRQVTKGINHQQEALLEALRKLDRVITAEYTLDERQEIQERKRYC